MNLIEKLYWKFNNVELPKINLRKGLLTGCESNKKIANKNFNIVYKEIINLDKSKELTDYQLDCLNSEYEYKSYVFNLVTGISKDEEFADVITESNFAITTLVYRFIYGKLNDIDMEKKKLMSRLEFFQDLIIFQTILTFYVQEKNHAMWNYEDNCFVVYNEIKNTTLFGFVCEYLSQIQSMIADLDEKNYEQPQKELNEENYKQLKKDLYEQIYKQLQKDLDDFNIVSLYKKHIDVFNEGVNQNFIEVVEESQT